MRKYLQILFSLCILVTCAFVFSACKKDDPDKPNPPAGHYKLGSKTIEMGDEWDARIQEIVNEREIVLTSTDGLQMPKVGEILIKTKSTGKFPHGFLGKVTEVKQEGGNTVIVTEEVSLEETFEELEAHFSENIAPYALDGEKFSSEKGNTLLNKSFEIKDAGITLTGTLDATVDFDFDVKIEGYRLIYLDAAINPKITVQGEYQSELSGKIDKEYKFGTIHFAAIPVGALLVTPSMTIYFVVGANGKIETKTTVSYTQSARYGVKYKDSKFTPYEESTSEKPFKFEGLCTMNGNLYAGVKFSNMFSIYGTETGVVIDLTPKISVKANITLNFTNMSTGGFYNEFKMANINAKVLLDGQVSIKTKLLWKEFGYDFPSTSLTLATLYDSYLLPHFKDLIKKESTETAATITYTVPNSIFFPAQVGMVLLDNTGKEIERKYQAGQHYQTNKDIIYDFIFTNLKSNMLYQVRPLVKFEDVPEITASPSFTFNLEGDEEGTVWATANACNYCTPGEALTACPGGWRLPTHDEAYDLCKFQSEWTNDPAPGRNVFYENTTLFFPALGIYKCNISPNPPYQNFEYVLYDKDFAGDFWSTWDIFPEDLSGFHFDEYYGFGISSLVSQTANECKDMTTLYAQKKAVRCVKDK